MKTFNIITCFGVLLVASLVDAYVPQGADTPAFYLVSSSPADASNLLPLRIDNVVGGYGTLTGSQPIGEFYFRQGKLVAAQSPGGYAEQRPLIDFKQIGTATCSPSGQLGFTQGSSSNKCAQYNSFYIQSFIENGQLGARLSFNFQGAFYACGNNKDVYSKTAPTDGPSGCDPIDLYTVPILQ